MSVRRTCNMPLWFHVLVEIWFDERKPLLNAAFNVTAALTYIASDYFIHQSAAVYLTLERLTASGQAQVRVCLCEDSQIKQVQYALVMKCEDALEYYHMRRIDSSGLFQPSMLFERVNWKLCFLATRYQPDVSKDTIQTRLPSLDLS